MVSVIKQNKKQMNTKSILTVAMVLGSFLSQAQSKDSTERMNTIFSGKTGKMKFPKYVGIYGASEAAYSQLNGQSVFMTGGQVGLLMNKKWGIALAGYSTMGNRIEASNAKGQYLSASYGGVRFEYTPKPNSVVHISFPLLLGGGMMNLDSLKGRDGFDKKDRKESNNRMGNKNRGNSYFVVQPGIQVEANLFRFVKLYAGASYRLGIQQEQNNALISSTALNGIVVNAGVKVGIFDLDLSRIHSRHLARGEQRRVSREQRKDREFGRQRN